MASSIYFLLDMSGSMDDSESDAIMGLNTWLKEISSKFPRIPVTVKFFNNTLRDYAKDVPAADVKKISSYEYRPSGGTALYDAIGVTINEIERQAMPLDGAMLFVYTDGGENGSREYDADMLRERISGLYDMGWIIQYLSSEDSPEIQANRLGIRHAKYVTQNSSGFADMFSRSYRDALKWLDGGED